MLWRGRNKFRDLEFLDKVGGIERIVTNPVQWFTEESVAKLYPLGTKLVVEDMVFRYAHISADSKVIYRTRGQFNLGKYPIANGPGHLEGDSMTAALIGAKSVTIHLIAADEAYVSAVAANEFENGRIAIFPSVWTGLVCGRVKENTALASSEVTFTLKEGIEAACGAGSTSKWFWNHYAYVGAIDATVYGARFKTAVVGVTKINATVGYYVWLQTWGPCLGQYGGAIKPGQGTDEIDLWFDRAGGLLTKSAEEVGSEYQRAGFVLPGTYTKTDNVQGWAPLFMLQISP